MSGDLRVEQATPERWRDLASLFGERGACAGCWCMWWRQSASEFKQRAGSSNRRALKRIVDAGRVPGLLAYRDGTPVGWCCVAPREEFRRLRRSRDLRPVDDRPAWSVVCFFVHRAARGTGVAAALLDASVRHAAGAGARIVEGYPVDEPDAWGAASAYTGFTAMFRKAGFRDVARRPGARRRVVRRAVSRSGARARIRS